MVGSRGSEAGEKLGQLGALSALRAGPAVGQTGGRWRHQRQVEGAIEQRIELSVAHSRAEWAVADITERARRRHASMVAVGWAGPRPATADRGSETGPDASRHASHNGRGPAASQ